jgi:hypothetical protein
MSVMLGLTFVAFGLFFEALAVLIFQRDGRGSFDTCRSDDSLDLRVLVTPALWVQA